MPTNPNDTYTSPLAARNASPEMCRIWSPRHKFNTWRRVWLAVAEAQYEVTKDWGPGGTALRAVIPASSSQAMPDDGSESRPTQPLVTKEQVEELRAVVERGITDAELERAGEIERDLRHDVMAHVHCLAEQCPKAGPIIHLGMTSQDVVCNADLLTIWEAEELVRAKVDRAVAALGQYSDKYRGMPTLGFTHYQAAQPTTVGRRSVGWAYDLCIAFQFGRFPDEPFLRGFRGATGTEASFLKLFACDEHRVLLFEAMALQGVLGGNAPMSIDLTEPGIADYKAKALEQLKKRTRPPLPGMWTQESMEACSIRELQRNRAECFVQESSFDFVGQTYPRVYDTQVLSDLASIAAVLHKIATDIRLLSNRKELDEPFGDKQIGSSAMPYKRNPMKCERICGLTRFVMNLVGNAYDTAATQWLERTLDDSSNRRLSLPEAFLALDGALDLMHTVASGLVVNEAMVRRNLMAELPFLATENILMEAVKAGGDRQQYHEIIRVHAHKAGHRVKQEGLDNDLLERLQADPVFHPPALKYELDWDGLMDPSKYIGRSVEQTERFLKEVIDPLRERYADELERLGSSDRGV